MTAGPAAGRLLVALPTMRDPNFSRTVVLLLAHGSEGTLGLVLNRPAGLPVTEVLPAWASFCSEPAVMFRGGPVGLTSIICLARHRPGTESTGGLSLPGDLTTIDLHDDPAVVGPTLEAIRMFAGSAGWEAGQLDAEIDSGGWVVVDATGDDGLCKDPDDLWRAVLARQSGVLRLYSKAPPDLSMN